MDRLRIQGGRSLRGEVTISGAKNAALPSMAAALLTADEVHLENLPHVWDIRTMRRLIEEMGGAISSREELASHRCHIRAENLTSLEAPYDLVKTMRASVLVLGPVLARFGHARVSLPGGCAIGARPIDLHIKALRKLGAKITTTHGYVDAKAEHLHGADIQFDRITVTGTENLMMAAALADGHTVLRNVAREPEIGDLADLLNKMGAKISGIGTDTLTIEGVESLHGATHRIISDRIEAGTFLMAAAITGGQVTIQNCCPAHLTAVVGKLVEAGLLVAVPDACSVHYTDHKTLHSVDLTTSEYPGFATDLQAQFMSLMTQAEGTSIITETIFENRFLHALELNRMGADISIDGRRAIVRGKTALTGATVIASDLRASASLVLAALAAQGETTIDRIYHLDRGYEQIEVKLAGLGADVARLKD
ncbi:MAG: UDP-N-acetylglucosamine 1-carboxyvinyltransferase [Acidobacteriia bacterium]|nr:UDP-N-acetylglucosamine 1-carboxyvinyltransferase [Terriglobia bacterium]